MSKGRNNKLAGQIGEYLVCAELARRDLIATPFSGNVPAFDILAADDFCRTVPIQVKASRSDNWPTDARSWMEISFDQEAKVQKSLGPKKVHNPDLICVCVAIVPVPIVPSDGAPVAIAPSDRVKDRFFILTKKQLGDIYIKLYSAWMDKHEWKRPKKPDSYDCRCRIDDLKSYENSWQLIAGRLATASPDQSLETTEE